MKPATAQSTKDGTGWMVRAAEREDLQVRCAESMSRVSPTMTRMATLGLGGHRLPCTERSSSIPSAMRTASVNTQSHSRPAPSVTSPHGGSLTLPLESLRRASSSKPGPGSAATQSVC
jgi:hypothetical protein